MKNISCPPASRLSKELLIPEENAKALRARIKKGYLRSDYDLPRDSHYSHAASLFMDELNRIAGGTAEGFFGCESLYPQAPSVFYLNTGDSYNCTLIFRPLSGTVRLGDIGSVIERLPRAKSDY